MDAARLPVDRLHELHAEQVRDLAVDGDFDDPAYDRPTPATTAGSSHAHRAPPGLPVDEPVLEQVIIVARADRDIRIARGLQPAGQLRSGRLVHGACPVVSPRALHARATPANGQNWIVLLDGTPFGVPVTSGESLAKIAVAEALVDKRNHRLDALHSRFSARRDERDGFIVEATTPSSPPTSPDPRQGSRRRRSPRFAVERRNGDRRWPQRRHADPGGDRTLTLGTDTNFSYPVQFRDYLATIARKLGDMLGRGHVGAHLRRRRRRPDADDHARRRRRLTASFLITPVSAQASSGAAVRAQLVFLAHENWRTSRRRSRRRRSTTRSSTAATRWSSRRSRSASTASAGR